MVNNLFRKEEEKTPSIDIPSGFLPPEDMGLEMYRCAFCGNIEYDIDDIRVHLYLKHRKDLMRLTETKGRGFMDYVVGKCKTYAIDEDKKIDLSLEAWK